MASAMPLVAATFQLVSGDGRDVLLDTSWGQSWAYAQYAPACGDSCGPELWEGEHWRLGCLSTAVAQIAYFHRLCPEGSVAYRVPGFSETSMDFDKETNNGLCSWHSFVGPAMNASSDAQMKAVAKYEYAAALIVRKTWGQGTYELNFHDRKIAVMKHYGFEDIVVVHSKWKYHNDVIKAIVEEIDSSRPVQLLIKGKNDTGDTKVPAAELPKNTMNRTWVGDSLSLYHHVVVDGYEFNPTFRVHLNVGHSGFDNGWYDWSAPICFRHFPNGRVRADGSCARSYDDVSYRVVWRMLPPKKGTRSNGPNYNLHRTDHVVESVNWSLIISMSVACLLAAFLATRLRVHKQCRTYCEAAKPSDDEAQSYALVDLKDAVTDEGDEGKLALRTTTLDECPQSCARVCLKHATDENQHLLQ
eukprot:gnl/MRDRNA2_/MRDRNA2_16897_c0_seq1.p1 gnl/MRDRNA2_/MRDRNA2_16897_c0~~gnl/MRDRNA2_/MRDRNA2_16897_c0_seq1.p1  ORF type:complete len:415 (+),score=49.70 gnl/MRDRNA2_/MRDRNA2_16897_c0_seq1:86-1330(+)